jgi:hypothetical protein
MSYVCIKYRFKFLQDKCQKKKKSLTKISHVAPQNIKLYSECRLQQSC